MTRDEIERGLLNGVRRAVKCAFSWSNGVMWPGDSGAENLLQVMVAGSLYDAAKTSKPAVYLEPTLATLAGEAAIPRPTRRVDIGLLYRSAAGETDKCFAAIEIKKSPVPYDEDLGKIAALMAAVGSLKYCYLLTYFQKQRSAHGNSKSLGDLISKTQEEIEEYARKKHKLSGTALPPRRVGRLAVSEGDWDAAALTMLFERPG